MIKKIRSKVVEKEAIQFTDHTYHECAEFIGKDNYDNTLNYPNMKTLEGVMRVDIGDWIIKGTLGEFYPCKPEAFENSYDIIL